MDVKRPPDFASAIASLSTDSIKATGENMAETTPINNQLEIDAVWDDAAEVWVAESDGVPGLVTEADSREIGRAHV